jgi:hypothetical protein
MSRGYWNLRPEFFVLLGWSARRGVCVILVPVTNPPQNVEAGLCSDCRHARTITSDRGSSFIMCQFSAVDPTFPKYPRLPVLSCIAYLPTNELPRTADS